MALKAKLTKEAHAALSDVLKNEYKLVGEEYVLDVEGGEDVGALKRAKEHEKTARQEAERLLRESKDAHVATQEELDNVRRGAIPKADVQALEASWQSKLETANATAAAALAGRDKALEAVTIDSKALQLATEISTTPELIAPVIKSRLKMELSDTGAIVRVLDPEGKPSALTLKDLGEELKANPAYASVIIGSKASGGGANGNNNGGGAAKKLSEMGDAERTALYKSNPAEFNRLVEAEKTS